jgi:RHS repeat-associated protein
MNDSPNTFRASSIKAIGMTTVLTIHLSVLLRFMLLLIVVISFVGSAMAQDSSQYDKGTPPQFVAGVSQVGSYMSTDLGTVNLGNGSLNFKLPMGQIGGRGFNVSLTLNYSSKLWSVDRGTAYPSDGPIPRPPQAVAWAVYDDPMKLYDYYSNVAPGWTIGAVPTLKGQGSGIYSSQNPQNGCTNFAYVVTKLTLVLPDKGEIEFRDDLYDGQPRGTYLDSYGCYTMDYSRGVRWHATDGSGAVFINDVPNGVATGNLNGWVITSDGTRYRFENTPSGFPVKSAYLKTLARCTSIIDRNGNKIQINYPNSSEVDYVDQLGRITKLQYNLTDPDNPQQTLALFITVPGYNGQNRYYKIKTGVMNQNFRSDLNIQTPVVNGNWDPDGLGCVGNPLFPQSYGGGCERIDDKTVLTDLVLPDGRSLKFAYNEYGEVAEVTMPTGGKLQYDYAYTTAMPSGNSYLFEVQVHSQYMGTTGAKQVDRAVTTRRSYANGTALESIWTYSYDAVTNGSTTDRFTDVKAFDSGNNLLMNQRHYFMQPGRFLTNYGGTGYSLWSTGIEKRTEVRDASGNVISASEQDWSQRTPVFWSTDTPYPTEQIANDNRVNVERSILEDGKTSHKETNYDNFNNPIEVREYDFDGSLKRKMVTSYLVVNPVNNLNYTSDSIRQLRLPMQTQMFDGNGNEKTRTIFEYDNYANDGNHLPLAGYATVSGHDTTNYGVNNTVRGNPTVVGSWLNTNNTIVYSYSRFDILGNVVSTKDRRGYVSYISYEDNYGNGSNPNTATNNPSTPTYANPTLLTSPPPTQGAQPHTAKIQFDFSTGLLTGFLDRNGVIAQSIYNDPFNRPTLVKTAVGTSLEQHAAMYYAGLNSQTVFGVTLEKNDALTVKDLKTMDDAAVRSWVKTDGFGRTTETWAKDSSGDVKTTTVYDSLGRTKQVSNPYRPSLNETAVYTTTDYDIAGRVIRVTTPDGAKVESAYNSNTTTVTDQALRKRRSITDGLGRLIRVDEPKADTGELDVSGNPYQTTNYAYDVFDNLIQVQQGQQTIQTRTFVYDSLMRLVTATNPEMGTTPTNGTITYAYDDGGNLLTKTDPRGVVTNYTYDAFSRPLTRSYQNDPTNTPSVSYTYDTLTNGKGRLTSVVSTNSSNQTVSANNITSYDLLGRVTASNQVTDGQTYMMSYGYDLSGNLLSQTYPSGRVVTNSFDVDGKLASVASQLPNQTSRTYANAFTYTSHGAVSSMRLGNGKWESTSFNSRLQPIQIGLGSSANNTSLLKLNYDYGTTDNNGNVKKQTITIPGMTYPLIQENGYDYLNRITTVEEKSNNISQWKQTFTYDCFGNRRIDVNNTTPSLIGPNPVISETNNRIVPQTGEQYLYDSAGNLTRDKDGNVFVYDGENKLITYNGGATQGGANYVYDGDGKRVKKIVGSVTTIFVYNAVGQMVAEYSTQTPPTNGSTSYLTSDTLGTSRMNTDAFGSVKARHDYLPFGEETSVGMSGRTQSQGYLYGTGYTDGVRNQFTGYERDSETGLDFAQARMYASNQGRFTTTDPIIMEKKRLADPQAINLYVYVRNNPLIYTDPNGERYVDENGNPITVGKDAKGKIVVTCEKCAKDSKQLANVQKLADAINATGSKTALKQFMALNDSKTKVHFLIDTSRDGDGKGSVGLTQPYGERLDGSRGPLEFKGDDPDNQNFDGKAEIVGGEYVEANITFYAGYVSESLSPQDTEDRMVDNFVHEAEHILDKEQVKLTETKTGSLKGYHPESLYKKQEDTKNEIKAFRKVERMVNNLLDRKRPNIDRIP